MKTYPTRLAMIADLPPGSKGAEIGVQRGDFAAQILTTPVRQLALVDLWSHRGGRYALDPADIDDGGHESNFRHVLARFGPDIAGNRVSVLRKDSVSAATLFANESLTFAYIDAGHGYEDVLADLWAWEAKIEAGGCLCGHDFVDNAESRRMGFGVKRAVEQFCQESVWRLTAVTQEEWASYKLERA